MTNLKQTRMKLGITATELSKRIGVSRQNISLAEKKGLRNAAAAKRYATALNCDWKDLLD